MKPNGFMLIEFLIYLAVFSSIMLMLSSMVTRLWVPAMHYTKKHTNAIDLVTAHECFARDVRIAKSEKNFWKFITQQALVFKSGWRDVCWCVKDNDLVRIEGDFDEKTNTWRKQTKNLIARSIDSIAFTVNGESEVRYVSFSISKNDERVESEVAIINGILPWKIKKP